ncbi:hypothetical protein BU16DRAFT_16975 [Lophium mytilinum]|uniref:Uncharacterized protein n=1 Tax=Lophium mytilinum TaxID=390894 RepID=A0A6A6RG69_9PEZI|nr:hypothetical protein BU16DRAFT_16975 [Lophium mytilinum]
MATVTFAMGSKDAYFFNTPTHWAWKNLPPDVESLFKKQPAVKEVFELALGDQGAYFVSFRDADGLIYCRHFNLPNPLTSWLYNSQPQIIRDLTKLYITLGQYESYYAADGSSSSWANLPPTLEKALESRRTEHSPWKPGEEPTFVSLGAEGRYFMRTANGGGGWELKGKAEGINKYLTDAPNFSDIAGLWLFPSHPDCYIMTTMEGKAFSNLPEHTWQDYTKMAHSIPDLRPKPQMQPMPMMVPQQMSPQPVLYAQPQQFAPNPMSPPPGYVHPFQPQPQTLVPQPMIPQATGVAYGQPQQRAVSAPQTPLTPLTPMTPPPQYAATPVQLQGQFFPPQPQQFAQPQQQPFAQPQQQPFAQPQQQFAQPQQPQQAFAQPLQQPFVQPHFQPQAPVQSPVQAPVQAPIQDKPASNSRVPQALLGAAAATAVGGVVLGKFLGKGSKGGKSHGGGHGGGHSGGEEQYTGDPSQQGGDPSQYGGDPSQYGVDPSQYGVDPSQYGNLGFGNLGLVDPGYVDPGQQDVVVESSGFSWDQGCYPTNQPI